jgi:hypothetical protein
VLGYFRFEPFPDHFRIGHEILEFIQVIGFDLKQPSFAVAVLVDQLSFLFQFFVHRHQLTGHY